VGKKRKATKAAVSKRYDLDVGKQRSRARLRKFIKKHLHGRKKAYVLCFPGSYGTEIEAIYRKLGIPDHNIFGVERDPAAAKRIQERYPDINVYCGEMNDFIYSYEGPPFDIVSLDYCGYFAQKRLGALTLLAGRHMLAERAVVAVNFLAGREQSDTQDMIRMQYARAQMDRKKVKAGLWHTPDTVHEITDIMKDAKEEDLSVARDDAITFGISSILGFTTPSTEISFNYDLKKCRGKTWTLSLDTEVLPSTKDGGIKLSNVKEGDTDDKMHVAQMIKHEAIQQIVQHLDEFGVIAAAKAEPNTIGAPPEFFDYHLGRTLVMAWYDKYSNPHLPVEMERYSYVSESGRRMLCDFVLTKQIDLSKLPDAIGVFVDKDDPDHHNFLLSPKPTDFPDYRSYLMLLKKIVRGYANKVATKVKTDAIMFPDRIDLGGGKAIPFDEDKIKQRIVALIEKGRTNEEIAAKYSIYTPNQIRAIRAHVTMGTYDTAQGRQSG
jgi:hypothetical protein